MFIKKEVKIEDKGKNIKCTTCGETALFSTATDQRQHFKTEWHVGNVKRKAKNMKPLTEEDHKVEDFNNNYH